MNSFYQLLGELSISLISSMKLTNSVGENLWDFQFNDEVTQQSHENQPSLDLVEILNITSKDGRESSLNISLKEVLTADTVEDTAVIGNKIGRVLRS